MVHYTVRGAREASEHMLGQLQNLGFLWPYGCHAVSAGKLAGLSGSCCEVGPALAAEAEGLRDARAGSVQRTDASMLAAACPLESPVAAGADTPCGAMHATHNGGVAAKTRAITIHMHGPGRRAAGVLEGEALSLGLLLQQANGKLVASPAPCRRSCLHFGDGVLCGR